MQAQQENKSLKETYNSSKKTLNANNNIAFENYASQCKIKPYPEPRGPLAPEVVLGGSLPDTSPPVIQHKKNEEEKPLQGMGNIQLFVESKNEVPAKPNNTGLPDKLKNGVENLSGFSMDDVKVHYNSSKPAQLQALAFAQGTDIHVAPGQEQHLPHETWHVVQQKQGRVKPTMQMKEGLSVNDDKDLEMEADVMGHKAIDEKSISLTSITGPPITTGDTKMTQRMMQDTTPPPSFDSGEIVNYQTKLVVRFFNGQRSFMEVTKAELHAANPGSPVPTDKQTWPENTMTGKSLMSSTKPIPDLKPMVVLSVPNTLQIVQSTENIQHAEFRTAQALTTSKIAEALKSVKFTGIGDAQVVQLQTIPAITSIHSSNFQNIPQLNYKSIVPCFSAIQLMKLGEKELKDMIDKEVIEFLNNPRKNWGKYFKDFKKDDLLELLERVKKIGGKTFSEISVFIENALTPNLDSGSTMAPAAAAAPVATTTLALSDEEEEKEGLTSSSKSYKAKQRLEKKEAKQGKRKKKMKMVSAPKDVDFGHSEIKHSKGKDQAISRSGSSSSQEAGVFLNFKEVCEIIRTEAFRFIECKQNQYLTGGLTSDESYDSTIEIDETLAAVYSGSTLVPGPYHIRMVVTRLSLEEGSLKTMYPVSKNAKNATNTEEEILSQLGQKVSSSSSSEKK